MNENIYIKNPEELDKKIVRLKEGGASNFHVISDFDRTLTPAFVEGQKVGTNFAKIREGKYLGEEYSRIDYEMYALYRPQEIDDNISLEEKKKIMFKWWSEHMQLMVDYKMTRDVVLQVIKDGKVVCRNGTKEFLDTLAQKNIPVLILSAGLGNIVDEYLRHHGLFHPNMHIVSNFLNFGEDGKATGYIHDVVHTFNKNEGHVRNSPYFKQIEGRRNVLLLGDTPGDTTMLEGLDHDTIIKIGYVNKETEKNKEKLAEFYDVLILDDGNMNYVNDLLKHIL